MSRPGADADVFAYMNAYAVLEVEYSATAAEIRRAYRRLAQHAHPDRYPSGSDEQHGATARMAAINDAYRLIREAPLRHHPVSARTDPDAVWADTDLDHAVRRARAERVTLDTIGACLMGAAGCFFSLAFVSRLGYLGTPGFTLYAVGIPVLGGLLAAVLGRRFWNVWYLADALVSIARIVLR